MNLLIFLNLTYNLGKNFKFYSLQGQNFKFFLIFTYNQGKVFLILPITQGSTCIPGLQWELMLIKWWSDLIFFIRSCFIANTDTFYIWKSEIFLDYKIDEKKTIVYRKGTHNG